MPGISRPSFLLRALEVPGTFRRFFLLKASEGARNFQAFFPFEAVRTEARLRRARVWAKAPRGVAGVLFDLHATRCAALLPLIRGGASNAATDPSGPRLAAAASILRTSRELVARAADAAGTSRWELFDRQLAATDSVPDRLCSGLDARWDPGITLTRTPRCVGFPRHNSPRRSAVARRAAASLGPEGSVAAFEAPPRISGSNAAQRVACRSKRTPATPRGAFAHTRARRSRAPFPIRRLQKEGMLQVPGT